MRSTELVRIDVNLWKAIKNKQKELEKELGIEVSFPMASKIYYLELQKENIKYNKWLFKK